MANLRPIHPDFNHFLERKDQGLVDLFVDLRNFLLELHPDSNELLYHTHALTTVFTPSTKMTDGFCLVPIYTKHLNLGFSRGTLLEDPKSLLQGTGKWMRHIPVKQQADYRNAAVVALVKAAQALALEDMGQAVSTKGKVISKIKR